MGYDLLTAHERACQGTRRDGTPCRAWAVWGTDRCNMHGGRRAPGQRGPTPCTCIAYAWPHRPAGGLCRWPYAPRQRLTTRAGTHRLGSSTRRRMARWRAQETAMTRAYMAESAARERDRLADLLASLGLSDD